MAIAAMAASTAIQTIGAIRQGNANASVSDYNAQVANQNADLVQQQGLEQQRIANVQAGKQIGGMVAAYGASGVTSDGSATDVIRNSAANAELNSLTIKNNSDIKATALRNEASLDYYRSSNDKVAGYMNAASSVLQSGGRMAMMSSGGGAGNSGVNGSAASQDLYDSEDT